MLTHKRVTLEDVWPPIEKGLTHLLTHLTEGFNSRHHIILYNKVWLYCSQPTGDRSKTGANMRGEELYLRTRTFMEKHVQSLAAVCSCVFPVSQLCRVAKLVWTFPCSIISKRSGKDTSLLWGLLTKYLATWFVDSTSASDLCRTEIGLNILLFLARRFMTS